MGKQKIDRLLAKLQDNHQQDIQTAAAIFTVAQGAVNQLAEQPVTESAAALPPTSLPPAPRQLTKADLTERYGNYNACRKAAKQAGITFSRSPRWPQIVAAFNYLEACQGCVDSYLASYPAPALKGTKITLTLGG